MIEFKRRIGKSEEKTRYLKLVDDQGTRYGKSLPEDKTPLWIVTEGRKYKASKKGDYYIWGALRSWYKGENVHIGDKIHIQYDPEAEEMDGRIPIEISIVERAELSDDSDEDETVEPDDESTEVSIQMERDLEDFLVNNLNLIEEGLKLYADEQGQNGRQYSTDVGTIDLLCRNKDDWVIVELKKGRSSDRVVGQISRYIGWVSENLAEGRDVRGIIIVHEFDPKLKYAVLAHQNLELKYYEIQIKFVSEQQIMDKLE